MNNKPEQFSDETRARIHAFTAPYMDLSCPEAIKASKPIAIASMFLLALAGAFFTAGSQGNTHEQATISTEFNEQTLANCPEDRVVVRTQEQESGSTVVNVSCKPQ